ncbi:MULTISPECIES: hypothetical protein [Pseudomonas]|uniref:hypothetical protein n=1 Tax=Pseudomonas TaxID=286 RepID=UPI0015768E45|nr:hypothetical protein [Pseudomonas sp. R76]
MKIMGAKMQRKKKAAVKCWLKLYTEVVSEQDIESQYFRLLRMADDMESSGVISGEEWRMLVRRAGELISSSADEIKFER